MLRRVKKRTLLAVAGAVAGTVAVSGGVTFFALGGDEGPASARPSASVRDPRTTREFAQVLKQHGASRCVTERRRVECRVSDRYVAAEVVGGGLDMASVLGNWKTGTAQAMTGDRGSFAILYGTNWLVTGPDEFVAKVRGDVPGGRVIYCDRPYSVCQ
jgi:hypothetical protein